MGRRKIEIQPITHERNRSVTFLKRKNGLFKKAYELGVLCSVDVAVIIFEERPGHHLKLYQYCSTDINDIVQRHIRYDGEKDTRGPSDFSGNSASKHDDLGDGDDDDVDDDDPQDMRSVGTKRRGDGKLKPDFGKPSGGMGDLGMGVDLDYSLQQHRTMAIPQPPMSMQHPSHLHSIPHSSSSGLPISSDRHGLRSGSGSGGLMPHQGQNPNKKPRIAPSVNTHGISNHSRSSSDDPHSGGASSVNGAAGYYQPSPTTNPNFRHPSHPSAPPNSLPGQYAGFFNMSTPPPFGGGFDYGGPSSSRAPASPSSATSTFSNARYDQARNVTAHLGRSHSAQGGPGGGGQQRDLFSTFLEADEQTRAASHNHSQAFKFGGGPGGGLDWPVHTQAANQGPPPPGPNSSTTPSSAGGQDSNTWLDFLSGSGVPPGGGAPGPGPGTGGGGGGGGGGGTPVSAGDPGSAGPGIPPPSARDPPGMSWERERHDMFAGVGRGGSAHSGHASGDDVPRKGGDLKQDPGGDMQ